MVFSTHALRKAIAIPDRAFLISPGFRRILLLFSLLLAQPLQAEEFSISDIHTRLQENVYLLDARIEYEFSEDALTALENGVPLTFRLSIEIQRKREWWLDATVANLEQRYRLRYHPLSHQYLLQLSLIHI